MGVCIFNAYNPKTTVKERVFKTVGFHQTKNIVFSP